MTRVFSINLNDALTGDPLNNVVLEPRDRILVQADLYDATWLRHSWGENVLQNLAKRGLKPEKSVPVHGVVEPFTQMVANIKAKPS